MRRSTIALLGLLLSTFALTVAGCGADDDGSGAPITTVSAPVETETEYSDALEDENVGTEEAEDGGNQEEDAGGTGKDRGKGHGKDKGKGVGQGEGKALGHSKKGLARPILGRQSVTDLSLRDIAPTARVGRR